MIRVLRRLATLGRMVLAVVVSLAVLAALAVLLVGEDPLIRAISRLG